MTMSKTLKPGTPAPKSGQYKNPGTGNEVTGVKGKPLPPTARRFVELLHGHAGDQSAENAASAAAPA